MAGVAVKFKLLPSMGDTNTNDHQQCEMSTFSTGNKGSEEAKHDSASSLATREPILRRRHPRQAMGIPDSHVHTDSISLHGNSQQPLRVQYSSKRTTRKSKSTSQPPTFAEWIFSPCGQVVGIVFIGLVFITLGAVLWFVANTRTSTTASEPDPDPNATAQASPNNNKTTADHIEESVWASFILFVDPGTQTGLDPVSNPGGLLAVAA